MAVKVGLVTGANRGIGREIARGLGRAGVHVLVGSRDEVAGTTAAEELRAEGASVDPVRIDVTEPDSITRVAADVERRHGRLDILVNNAGIAGGFAGAPSDASAADLREVFETNVFGVVSTTGGFLPLLRRAPAGRIVNISSHLASLTLTSDPGSRLSGITLIAYQSSKAALNAITVAYANEFRATPIKVNLALPGMVASGMNTAAGQRTLAQAAAVAVTLALLDDDGPTGVCMAEEGVIPW